MSPLIHNTIGILAGVCKDYILRSSYAIVDNVVGTKGVDIGQSNAKCHVILLHGHHNMVGLIVPMVFPF